MTQPRECGTCTFCCTVLGVPELAKAPGERCVHLTSKGCGIYDERPEACRTFDCSWLKGSVGDMTTRPDKLRAVMGGDTRTGHNVLYVMPGDEDRWRKSKNVLRQVRATLESGHKMLVVAGENRTEVKLK